jgi:hypothetical protein
MTERKGKTCGFVVDLNIHRAIQTTMDYAMSLQPGAHPKKALEYVIKTRIINLNMDHFENSEQDLDKFIDKSYNLLINDAKRSIKPLMNRLTFDGDITPEEQQHINLLYIILNKSTKHVKEMLKPTEIKKGIEKTNKNDANTTPPPLNESQETNMDLMDILKHVIPLMCILTIHHPLNTFRDMYYFIQDNENLHDILVTQIQIWCGQKTTINISRFKELIHIYIKYMADNEEHARVIQTVKEIFTANRFNSSVLSQLIDEYFIPQELEKKENAEVTTPYELRQEMLDTVPKDFWKTVRPVFEPSAGKGGFIIDIIDRFMGGLKHKIPDEHERRKIIIEKCLYFSDINSMNIFICKALINPDNEFTLNCNEGDTLKLNVKEMWGINGFDAIIGNPPYNEVNENGTSKGGGNNLYTKFIYYADKYLNADGYLLFINPPTYFGPGRSNNKTGMNLRKDILDHYYYHYVNLEECKKYFSVGSKFMYYLIQKNNNTNDKVNIVCKYKNNVYNTILDQTLLVRDYVPYLITDDCLKILDKIKNRDTTKLHIFHSPDNRSDKKHVLKKKKRETNEEYKKRALETEYIYPMQATGVQLVYSSKKCKNQDDKKVLMSRSGYLKPFYDDGDIGVGGDCYACLVKDKDEGKRIINLLNSTLYKFYIETNKWSGFHNKEVLQDLPNIDFEPTDESMYKFFNLTKKEIQHVENN